MLLKNEDIIQAIKVINPVLNIKFTGRDALALLKNVEILKENYLEIMREYEVLKNEYANDKEILNSKLEELLKHETDIEIKKLTQSLDFIKIEPVILNKILFMFK